MNSLKMKLGIAALATVALALVSSPVVCAQKPALNWVGSWAASQQLPEPQNSLPPELLNDATLRQIVHLSVGGNMLRIHLSNAFGVQPLHFTGVHIARPLSPATSAVDPATDKPVTFSGKLDVIIPAGAEFISDPIE